MSVAKRLCGRRALQNVSEGSEPAAFWGFLGGRGEYPSEKKLFEMAREPQLFHCSNARGVFDVEPIHDYSQVRCRPPMPQPVHVSRPADVSQDDLEEDDVYLLDVYVAIYVWVGSQSNEEEKRLSLELAAKYVRRQNYARDTPVVKVTSGCEPPMFTANFLGWDPSRTKMFVDPYEAKLAAAHASNERRGFASPSQTKAEQNQKTWRGGEQTTPTVASLRAGLTTPAEARPAPQTGAAISRAARPGGLACIRNCFAPPTYSYEELKADVNLPNAVDRKRKERYLSDDEFERVLGSSRKEFAALRPWKQQALKKAAGLY